MPEWPISGCSRPFSRLPGWSPGTCQTSRFAPAPGLDDGSAGRVWAVVFRRSWPVRMPAPSAAWLSHRDPGVTVERHPAAPLAGMGKSIPSCQGEINRVFQPPPELQQGGIPSRGRKQGCFQPGPPGVTSVGNPSYHPYRFTGRVETALRGGLCLCWGATLEGA